MLAAVLGYELKGEGRTVTVCCFGVRQFRSEADVLWHRRSCWQIAVEMRGRSIRGMVKQPISSGNCCPKVKEREWTCTWLRRLLATTYGALGAFRKSSFCCLQLSSPKMKEKEGYRLLLWCLPEGLMLSKPMFCAKVKLPLSKDATLGTCISSRSFEIHTDTLQLL